MSAARATALAFVPESGLFLSAGVDIEQALIEYAAIAEYYPGEEARCRLALLLQKIGRVARGQNPVPAGRSIGRSERDCSRGVERGYRWQLRDAERNRGCAPRNSSEQSLTKGVPWGHVE
jgi:hypothetical protein